MILNLYIQRIWRSNLSSIAELPDEQSKEWSYHFAYKAGNHTWDNNMFYYKLPSWIVEVNIP